MGRGRVKGRKQAAIVGGDDGGSSEEEKIPTSKRRGKPTRPIKDEIEHEEDELEKEEGGCDPGKNAESMVEIGRKKRRPGNGKEADSVKEESVVGANMESSPKFVGFRQNGSRRKSKPRRAAEVGVECN